ncbi:MAG: hypothetical protein ACI9WV_000462 [Patiriisocius sp.]|jgi:hypothetical protein
MKNKLYILLFLITVFSCKAQEIVNINTFNQGNNEGKYFNDINNVFANFLGTWEYQTGNTIFRITLIKLTKHKVENGKRTPYYIDKIEGHYKKAEIDTNGNETIIYTSQKKMGQTNTDWPFVIYGTAYDIIQFNGQIYDNSITPSNGFAAIRGILKCEIIPNTNPKQMTWKVTLPQGMYGSNQPTTFNIPTDIILTKK